MNTIKKKIRSFKVIFYNNKIEILNKYFKIIILIIKKLYWKKQKNIYYIIYYINE